jgi:hypothetical protein
MSSRTADHGGNHEHPSPLSLLLHRVSYRGRYEPMPNILKQQEGAADERWLDATPIHRAVDAYAIPAMAVCGGVVQVEAMARYTLRLQASQFPITWRHFSSSGDG